MYHVSLNRAWSYNRYFDHQVIKAFWPQSWQHGHLRAAFDLEHTDGIGMTDHLIDCRIILRNIGQRQVEIVLFFSEIKPFSNTREHTQCQYIYFQKAERLDVILVPFDVRAIFHAGVEDRAEVGQLAVRDHKASGMLAQLPGKAYV